MTTTETPTEAAFWAAIDERPDDQLRRLVFADWLDEQAGTVECGRCGGEGKRTLASDFRVTVGNVIYQGTGFSVNCPACSGTGRVSNGRAELAMALRATVDRVPAKLISGGAAWALEDMHRKHYTVSRSVWMELRGDVIDPNVTWNDYPTAADAIRDLCRAWHAVHGGA